MNLNIYTIYDTAAAAYMRPFFLQSDGQAKRMFNDIANDADHDIGKHPEDYTLMFLGTFNDQTAKIHPENPQCLATALECVAAAKNINRDQLNLLEQKINGDDLHVGGTD